jgi:hypothetical protein
MEKRSARWGRRRSHREGFALLPHLCWFQIFLFLFIQKLQEGCGLRVAALLFWAPKSVEGIWKQGCALTSHRPAATRSTTVILMRDEIEDNKILPFFDKELS